MSTSTPSSVSGAGSSSNPKSSGTAVESTRKELQDAMKSYHEGHVAVAAGTHAASVFASPSTTTTTTTTTAGAVTPVATSLSAASPPIVTVTKPKPLYPTTAAVNQNQNQNEAAKGIQLPDAAILDAGTIVQTPTRSAVGGTHFALGTPLIPGVSVLSPPQLQRTPSAPSYFPAGMPLRTIDPDVFPLGNAASLPTFLSSIYQSSRAELAKYDALILSKIKNELGQAKLRAVEVVVGIPFYTEVANIHSVLVTMRDVFQQRKQRALFVVLGEFARQDCIQEITDCHEIELGETWEKDAYVSIETMWKPHPKYASKPWTVRALQIIASQCGARVERENSNGMPQYKGAHLLIMDADIQFNHWELSARSLVNALLDPLMSWEANALSTPSTPLVEPAHAEYASFTSANLPVPKVQSRNDPFYPSPMPQSLLNGNINPAPHSFSPIFAVRTPDEYDSNVKVPSVPIIERDASSIKQPPPPSTFVVLNAPRSFFADDAVVHLCTYLHTYMSLGLEIHQGHGGEFSIHRDLNHCFLRDDTLVYDRCYCVESQMAHRASFIHPTTHPELFPSIHAAVKKQKEEIQRQTSAETSQEQKSDPPTLPSSRSETPTLNPASASAQVSAASFSAPKASPRPVYSLSDGFSVLEVLMKGKWHAKITLNKLLAFENDSPPLVLHASSPISPPPVASPPPPLAAAAAAAMASVSPPAVNFSPAPSAASVNPAVTPDQAKFSRARIDLVSEKLLNESLYFSALHLVSPRHSSPRPLCHHVGGVRYIPDPDPKAQSLKVLAPTSTRKQMVKSLKEYYHTLLVEHVTSSKMNLPIQSKFIQEFLPLVHRQVCKRQSSVAVNYIITHARADALETDPWHPSKFSAVEREKFLIFGPAEWAELTVELLLIYASTTAEQAAVRRAVICAHRLVWLLGCVAFLNDHSHVLWGHMHSSMHQIYAPVFRRKFLSKFVGLDDERVEQIMKSEGIYH